MTSTIAPPSINASSDLTTSNAIVVEAELDRLQSHRIKLLKESLAIGTAHLGAPLTVVDHLKEMILLQMVGSRLYSKGPDKGPFTNGRK